MFQEYVPALLRADHGRVFGRLLALSLAVGLTACATGPILGPGTPLPPIVTPQADSVELKELRNLISMQDRLYRVGAPLLVNNTELCKGNARNLLGFTAKNKYSYSSEFVDTAQQGLGLSEPLQVMNVLTNGGASKAGIQRGDVLVAVEGQPMPQGQNAERQTAALLAPLVTGKAQVRLSLLRNGAPLAVNVPLTYACAFGLELGQADHVNAYADGHRVLLTRGMLNFVQSDEELAYVLAKGMAHNALAHAQRLRINGTVGGIIDNLIRVHPDMRMLSGRAGVRTMPPEMDAAADALALYMTARAGYRIDQAPSFWKRLASQVPPAVLNGYNAIHSPIATRLPTIETTATEIRSKQAAKQPLLP